MHKTENYLIDIFILILIADMHKDYMGRAPAGYEGFDQKKA